MLDNDSFFQALKKADSKPSRNPASPFPSVGNAVDDFGLNNNSIGDFEVAERLAEVAIEQAEPIWKPELPKTLPPIKADIVAGKIPLTEQQRNNICIIAYSLAVRNHSIEPEPIYKLWPIEGDPFKLARAGKRPSLTGIQQFLATEDFSKRMAERGVDTAPVGGISPEQIALVSILSDSSSSLGLRARLKKAGITFAVYNAWRRQKPFADALQEAQGGVLQDAIGHADTQLAQMAQNGDLKAIVYMNELIGRGPNNRKAVDAIQFARIVLEAVQKNVSPDQARAISSEIELASKQLGIGA